MPLKFTIRTILERAEKLDLLCDESLTVREIRELVAQATIERYNDQVEAQEILSGRPWTEFTREDILEIEKRSPGYYVTNPGMIRRMIELDSLD